MQKHAIGDFLSNLKTNEHVSKRLVSIVHQDYLFASVVIAMKHVPHKKLFWFWFYIYVGSVFAKKNEIYVYAYIFLHEKCKNSRIKIWCPISIRRVLKKQWHNVLKTSPWFRPSFALTTRLTVISCQLYGKIYILIHPHETWNIFHHLSNKAASRMNDVNGLHAICHHCFKLFLNNLSAPYTFVFPTFPKNIQVVKDI